MQRGWVALSLAGLLLVQGALVRAEPAAPEAKPPAAGSSPASAPPAHGSASAPPAHGSASAPPAHGSASAPPAHGSASAPPAHGSASAPPAHDSTSAAAHGSAAPPAGDTPVSTEDLLDLLGVRAEYPVAEDPLIDDLERRTFRYFWDTTNKKNGLAPDRYPTPSFVSIAAIGFSLTAFVVGSERHFVERAQAAKRVRDGLRFLFKLPQGPEASGVAGYHGFYYHFLNPTDGLRFVGSELSTVDTALMLGGVLLAQSYFDRDSRIEREIRELADRIYQRVDWQWAQSRPPAISHGWRPEDGFLSHDWDGYNEAMLVYILALGSPTHPVAPEAWEHWTQNYDQNWGKFGGEEFLSFGPLFGHQYSHVWIDFHGIQDDYMREKGIDYFENSRRAAYAQREYARQNPMKWQGYDSQIWGLSACDGPADTVQMYNGQQHKFFAYAGRGTASTHALDDGTIAPTAAIASIAFAPEIVIPTIHAFKERYGDHLYKKYGFLDSINPSFTYADVKVSFGEVVGKSGWVAKDYLGIDQGPILAMIANYRSGLIWKIMQRNPYVQRGLERAGFRGGWLTELTKLAHAAR